MAVLFDHICYMQVAFFVIRNPEDKEVFYINSVFTVFDFLLLDKLCCLASSDQKRYFQVF